MSKVQSAQRSVPTGISWFFETVCCDDVGCGKLFDSALKFVQANETGIRMRVVVLFFLSGQTFFAAEVSPVSLQDRDHWAWKSPVAVVPPNFEKTGWTESPIDCFILARSTAVGLEPVDRACRAQLIRRVSFDLIGLPPTTHEVDDFINDVSPDAWERVIDRLMASPHFGERWGRHWLDLARYADSNGYEFDEVRPDAWRYRDYVIESFNNDKPYSQFLREQLAGDELHPDEPSALIATGFNLLGPDMTDSSDQVQRRQNTLNDMTDTAGLAFLGLTIGCARCHDHKFEPISQWDYYRLQAFFTSAKFRTNLNVLPVGQRVAVAEKVTRFEKERGVIRSALDELERPAKSRLREAKLALQSEEVRAAHETPEEKRTPAERERVAETNRFVNVSTAEVLKQLTAEERSRHNQLSETLNEIDGRRPVVDMAMGLQNSGKSEKTFLLERGDPAHPVEEVQPGFLLALTLGSLQDGSDPVSEHQPPKYKTNSTGQRTELANWLTEDHHPLTARVMVNRIWHHHFGRGIVRTPSDFGLRGDLPTHPELLDWLAVEFVRNGWSMKRMHRLMVSCATYRQSTTATSSAMKLDPDNKFVSRMNRRRLEGEIVRDTMLSVSGKLNSKQGGPGVAKPISSGDKGARKQSVTVNQGEYGRRSVYLFARRNLRNPFLEAFDLPDSNLSCSQRECSTTAPQALALFNDADVVDAARSLAERIQGTDDPAVQAYRLTLGRNPTTAEIEFAAEFLAESPLSEFCRALFNINEFVYVD